VNPGNLRRQVPSTTHAWDAGRAGRRHELAPAHQQRPLEVPAFDAGNRHWRAAEFPERHFGEAQAYGLIAQDVEQVLPELVETNSDGYKAVDYTKLPLLTLQAVKELKAENDALKQRVAELDPLKQRVAELERLLTDLVAKQR
jgi:hypothetical protein